MDEFPKTAEEFYARRDDRTDRYAGAARGYQEAHCLVTADPSVAETFPGQVILLATCNLLSRWCRRVTVVVPGVAARPQITSRSPALSEIILAQMHDADPFGAFDFAEVAPPGATVQLHAGFDLVPVAPRCTTVSATGWLATLSRTGAESFPVGEDDNCLGALAAACLGVAQVFKMALGLPDSSLLADGMLDLFTFRRLQAGTPSPNHPYVSTSELGRLLMVGAGSVGSAAAYCLKLMGARCSMAVVERDIVKVENFNRSPIFGKSVYGMAKAGAVVTHLAGSGVNATVYDMWWDDFVREHGRRPDEFDVWLPLANEFGVRWAMQNNRPPLLVHASTTSNWGVNHGRHIFGRDDCLADRFSSEVPREALQCSTAEVVLDDARVDAALPFLSMFAGLLVAAELARLQLPGYPQVPNFALLDFGGDLSEIQAWDMKPRPACLCTGQSATLHEKFNGRTKHYCLTHP